MRLPRLYTPQKLHQQTRIQLDDKAAQHLVKVLRFKAGAEVELFNGDGVHYRGTLVEASKKQVVVELTSHTASHQESPLHTHLGQVISRGDRMDYAVQKATELGVTEITPLFSERCEVRLNPERQQKRKEHWQQVAISAAEQCGRATVPQVHDCASLEDWIGRLGQDELGLVLHHRDQQNLMALPAPTAVRLLIGPEGGLSDREIKAAQTQGFKAATFGPRVWRTETAPVAALSIAQWLWGDLQTSSTDIQD